MGGGALCEEEMKRLSERKLKYSLRLSPTEREKGEKEKTKRITHACKGRVVRGGGSEREGVGEEESQCRIHSFAIR